MDNLTLSNTVLNSADKAGLSEILNNEEKLIIDKILEDLVVIEEKYKTDFGKYKRIYVTMLIDDNSFYYYVNEIVSPKNEVGYQLVITKSINGKTYRCKIGYGYDATVNTTNWYLLTTNL